MQGPRCSSKARPPLNWRSLSNSTPAAAIYRSSASAAPRDTRMSLRLPPAASGARQADPIAENCLISWEDH
jgi:hypothetical protein